MLYIPYNIDVSWGRTRKPIPQIQAFVRWLPSDIPRPHEHPMHKNHTLNSSIILSQVKNTPEIYIFTKISAYDFCNLWIAKYYFIIEYHWSIYLSSRPPVPGADFFFIPLVESIIHPSLKTKSN